MKRRQRQLPNKAVLDMSALVEARDESERDLMSLRAAIDTHLPQFSPAHEDGNYESTVKQAGEELCLALRDQKLTREALARLLEQNERLIQALENIVVMADGALKGHGR